MFEAFKVERNMTSDLESGVAYCTRGTIKRRSTKNGGDVKIANITLRIDLSENSDLKRYLTKMPKETQFQVYYLSVSKKNRINRSC